MLNNPSAIEHIIKVIDHGLTLMCTDLKKNFIPNRIRLSKLDNSLWLSTGFLLSLGMIMKKAAASIQWIALVISFPCNDVCFVIASEAWRSPEQA